MTKPQLNSTQAQLTDTLKPLHPQQLAAILDAFRGLLTGELTLAPVGDLRRAGASALMTPDRTHVQSQEEQTRERLVEYVREHPGCTCADAGRALGLTKSAVHHHANALETPPHRGGVPGAQRMVTTYRTISGRRSRVLYVPEHVALERAPGESTK